MLTEISTKRLHLRPLQADDLSWLGPLFADERVTDHLATGKLTGETAIEFAEDFIDTSIREFHDFYCGAMAVCSRQGRAAFGYAGLRPLPDRYNVAELIYAFTAENWNYGYASEAAAGLLSWGFDKFPDMTEIVAMARPENPASIKVMIKIGMQDRGINQRYYGEPLAIYSMRRSEMAAPGSEL